MIQKMEDRSASVHTMFDAMETPLKTDYVEDNNPMVSRYNSFDEDFFTPRVLIMDSDPFLDYKNNSLAMINESFRDSQYNWDIIVKV